MPYKVSEVICVLCLTVVTLTTDISSVLPLTWQSEYFSLLPSKTGIRLMLKGFLASTQSLLNVPLLLSLDLEVNYRR